MTQRSRLPVLQKCRTGIQGLDEITGGGLPEGRTTLICGDTGCGKTLFGIEFLVRGALDHDEPGVCVSFEETPGALATNVASLGFDINQLVADKKLALVHVALERSQIEETGEYDLEGLFVRLSHAIDSVGARRVLVDTVEVLFAGLQNEAVIRSELRRLFRWFAEKGVTAIVTGERGDGHLTRHGLEEYVSDCVIALEHLAEQAISTRRLRIVKYRGSRHGTNAYPFLIGDSGLSVLPITSLDLSYRVERDRVSTGIPALDEMLGGKGPYRGSTVLLSGGPGTGKTTASAHFCRAACQAGERVLYLAFEESADQITRNMASVGVDLGAWLKKQLLKIEATRSTTLGLESHLVKIHRSVQEFHPNAVVVDPVTTFLGAGSPAEVTTMIARLIDYLKQNRITTLMTNQTPAGASPESTGTDISSLVDTWILLKDGESNGERNRTMYILKSRGMAHSNQVREFIFTDAGIRVLDSYAGLKGGLVGSARVAQEETEKAEALANRQAIARKQREIVRKRRALELQVTALQSELEEDEAELKELRSQALERQAGLDAQQVAMARSRKVTARTKMARTKGAGNA